MLRYNTIKLLEENYCDLRFARFLIMKSEVQTKKGGKIDKLKFIKTISSYFVKDIVKRMRKRP